MCALILIVDDEPELVDSYARLIGSNGHDCLCAYDGPEAIRLIDAERPDLVLADINLPTGNGFRITQHVRQALPSVPVILMTAYHTSYTAQAAKEAGGATYLAKPFSNEELLEAIRTALAT